MDTKAFLTNEKFSPSENFRALAKDYSFKHAGFFSFQGQYYVLTKAFGLDLQTIRLSQSTPDFWDGALTKAGKWSSYSREDKDIFQFYQFFSPKFRDEIENLHFLKFYDEVHTYIFFVAELSYDIPLNLDEVDLFNLSRRLLKTKSNLDFSYDKISVGLKFSNANLYTIDLYHAIDNFFMDDEVRDQAFYADVYKSAFDEIYDLLQTTFSGRNISSSPEGKIIYICIFSKKTLSEESLLTHISELLKDIIPPNCLPKDFIKLLAVTDKIDQVNKFLLGEF